MKKKSDIAFFQTLSISLYVSFQIFSDILSTKIALIPFTNLAIDGGTIIYPFTFTLRDFAHKTIGKYNTRRLIIISAIINVIMVALFWIVGMLPSEPSWSHQQSYNFILLPIWRITLASVIAEVISEMIDTEIFDYFYKRFREITGVFVSNSIALVIDSLIFSFIAFSGLMPLKVVFQIAISNIIIKFILTVFSMPAIKLIPGKHNYDKEILK